MEIKALEKTSKAASIYNPALTAIRKDTAARVKLTQNQSTDPAAQPGFY